MKGKIIVVTSPQQTFNWHSRSILYGLVLTAAIVQVILSYKLVLMYPLEGYSITELLLIRLTVLIPIFAIWVLAIRGASRFKAYAVAIRKSSDGKSMDLLANGLLLLVLYIIAICFSAPIVALFRYTDHLKLVLALTNHVPMVLALVASWALFVSSRSLVELTNERYWSKRRLIYLAIPYISLMSLFALDFYYQAPQLVTAEGTPRFGMSHSILIFTYVIPHMLIWFFGIVSAINFAWYAKKIEGSIYRELFSQTYKGILLVYLSIFMAQLFIISPLVATHFGVGLLLVYGMLLLAILGYVLLFRGAVKLQRIEEAS